MLFPDHYDRMHEMVSPKRIFLPAVIQSFKGAVIAGMTINVSIAGPACQYASHKRRMSPVMMLQGGRANPIRMDDTVRKISETDFPALLDAVGKQRSVDAFEALFRYFGPRIKVYMARQTRDAQAAEELMQETMIAVWNKAALFDPARGNVAGWIFTIARNLRVDAHRKDRRPQFDATDPAFVQDDVPPADVGLEEQQDAERLHRAMAELPAEQLELLKRSFFDESSHSMIASQLGIPVGTVKSRIRLAFSKLRASLETRT
jgi:RNA polymerase sigma factor (sigma-70 family)